MKTTTLAWTMSVILSVTTFCLPAPMQAQESTGQPPVGLEDLQVLVDQGLLIRVEMNSSPPRVVVGSAFVSASAEDQLAAWSLLERFVRQGRPRSAAPVRVDATGQPVALKADSVAVGAP